MRDLTARIARLYAGDPGAFVTGRTALAKEAKLAGQPEVAKAVAALRKPTRGAWLVNLLAAEHPSELADLLVLAEALREAHADLAADQLRTLSTERNRVLAALARLAVEAGEQRGYHATAAVRQEVVQTLQAGMSDAELGTAIGAGILAQTAQPTGFGPLRLTELAPMAEVVALRPAGAASGSAEPTDVDPGAVHEVDPAAVREVDPAAVRRAERALARADLDLADAEDAAAAAAAALTETEQAATTASAEVARLRAAVVAAEQVEAERVAALARLREELERATRARDSARVARSTAEQALGDLGVSS
ncbi:hypothetical protein [Granulicoccus phenolivorans]|uniref:hypothetical protein n=1 Tax=Granulicoccus phenolivorans TaxID=266854 RepID=UPI0003F94B82|nr:hypothetical protein [Granulicoccus phenolivorans]